MIMHGRWCEKDHQLELFQLHQTLIISVLAKRGKVESRWWLVNVIPLLESMQLFFYKAEAKRN